MHTNEKYVDIDVYPVDQPRDTESLWFLDDKPHYTWKLHVCNVIINP